MKKFYTLLSILLLSANLIQAQPGNAYDYAGGGDPATGDYITLPTGIVQPLSGDYTIETWVYWRGGGDWQRIFDFGMSGDPSSATNGTWMFLTPRNSATSTMRFSISTTGFAGFQILDATVALPQNTWNHVALVYQSATNTMSIYLNGTLNTSGVITIRPSDMGATDQNWLGQSQFRPFAFSDPYFNGIIDEFRISNVARYTANFTPYPVQFTTDGSTRALYHFNETSGQVVDDASANNLDGFLGSTGAADGNDPSRITNSILPVNIISFVAQKSANGIELKWKASTTGDPGSFVIEKSTDGVRFQSIGTVAINTASSTASYSFVDHSAASRGKNYYRLRIEELNASAKFSRIVFVDMDGKNLYQAYPTATSSLVFVQVPKPTRITIYNSSGVLVKRMFLEQSQGVEVSNLSKGVYQIQFEGTREMIRFVKM